MKLSEILLAAAARVGVDGDIAALNQLISEWQVTDI